MLESVPALAGKSLSVAEIATLTGAALGRAVDRGRTITGVATLEAAERSDVCFMDHPRYIEDLEQTRAGACFVSRRFAALVPATTVVLLVPQPHHALAVTLGEFHPDELRPGSNMATQDVSREANIHPTARLGPGAIIDPGAAIGPRVVIGSGTTIGSHAVIGPDVVMGENCSVGPNATILRATLGDRVIVHPGARIGQDGFGFVFDGQRFLKVPQIGRVVIGDDVEIGANTTIDRGSNRDTTIGEGTKIDNLVQIGHNVQVGRHCVLVAQVGIAGSTVLEDHVSVGGQSAIAGHLRIGRGVQLAAASKVMHDVPAGETWGGMPAKSLRTWFREQTTLKLLTARRTRNAVPN